MPCKITTKSYSLPTKIYVTEFLFLLTKFTLDHQWQLFFAAKPTKIIFLDSLCLCKCFSIYS